MRQRKQSFDLQMLEDLFAFICGYNRQFGYSPTMRELSESCFMSRTNLYRYLDKLEMQGRISRDAWVARGITILNRCPDE